MKIKFILLFLLPFLSKGIAQVSLSYQDDLKFSEDIDKGYKSKKLKSTKAAQYYSYIGEHQAALESWEWKTESRWLFDTLTRQQQSFFQAYSPVAAIDYILKRAKNEQIILINESHHDVRHRVFTKRLLKGLRKAGFEYFGLEALANCKSLPPTVPCDTLLNERGYTLNEITSGTYIREPQMANLVRAALDLDFTLFAYEKFGKDRELHQAKYIAEVLERDPNAKILIQCGFAHNVEEITKEIRGEKMMGYYLKELTGINPFTINQYILSDAKPANKIPLYRSIDLAQPSAFINEQQEGFGGFDPVKMFDLLIYHPRTTYLQNRPDWLLSIPENKLYALHKKRKKIKIAYPWIVSAFAKKESDRAVPIDIIEISDEKDTTALVLPKGKYRLKFQNPTGATQSISIKVK